MSDSQKPPERTDWSALDALISQRDEILRRLAEIDLQEQKLRLERVLIELESKIVVESKKDQPKKP